MEIENPRSAAHRWARKVIEGRKLYRLSYICSLGDWNRTSGLVDPNHALSLLSYTQRKTRRAERPEDIQRLSHHTAAQIEDLGEARHQRIERCSSALEAETVPDGGV